MTDDLGHDLGHFDLYVPIVSGNWETSETWACGLGDLLSDVSRALREIKYTGRVLAERLAFSETGRVDEGVEQTVTKIVRRMVDAGRTVGIGHSYGASTLLIAAGRATPADISLVLYDRVAHGGEQVGAPDIEVPPGLRSLMVFYRGAIAPPWSSDIRESQKSASYQSVLIDCGMRFDGHCAIVRDVTARAMAVATLTEAALS